MKTTSLALLALLITGVAAPVFADEGEGPVFDADGYTTELQQKGLNVLGVDNFSADEIVATVRDADGHTSFAYFDKDTLQPVNNVGGEPTRVLSKLSVTR